MARGGACRWGSGVRSILRDQAASEADGPSRRAAKVFTLCNAAIIVVGKATRSGSTGRILRRLGALGFGFRSASGVPGAKAGRFAEVPSADQPEPSDRA